MDLRSVEADESPLATSKNASDGPKVHRTVIEPMPPRLLIDAAAVQAATFVKSSECADEMRSTNDVALQRDDRVEPYLVWTLQQTAGRGRGDHQWWSAAGALTFSVRLAYTGPIETRPMISLAAGAAVCGALIELFTGAIPAPRRIQDVQLKWPNDVYVQGRKICGILTESAARVSGAAFPVVIGIGLNVNNSLQLAPADVQTHGTALCDLLGYDVNLATVLISLLQHLERQLDRLATTPSEFVADWRTHCLLTGRQITLADGPRQIHGHCLGIANDGTLQIATAEGVYRAVSGSVESF